jgi:hypothetical protein
MSAAIFVTGMLAGQGRLIDAQVIGLDDARVGRDRVTGLEEQDVARHQLVSRDHISRLSRRTNADGRAPF